MNTQFVQGNVRNGDEKTHDTDNTAEGRRRKIRKVSKFEKAPADKVG